MHTANVQDCRPFALGKQRIGHLSQQRFDAIGLVLGGEFIDEVLLKLQYYFIRFIK
jgi:hypothetical protein